MFIFSEGRYSKSNVWHKFRLEQIIKLRNDVVNSNNIDLENIIKKYAAAFLVYYFSNSANIKHIIKKNILNNQVRIIYLGRYEGEVDEIINYINQTINTEEIKKLWRN